MRTIKFSLLIVVMSLIYGCTTNQVLDSKNEPNDNIEFIGTVTDQGNQVLTRKLNNSWVSGDKIGVYAYDSSGAGLSQATVYPELYNRCFITTSGNVFTVIPGTLPVEYPKESSSIHLVAYYPYSAEAILNDFIYPIDVSNQLNIDEVDFLYTNDSKLVSSINSRAILKFNHQLSKISLAITSKEYDLTGASVTAIGVPFKADFNLVKGGFLVDYSNFKDIKAYNRASSKSSLTAEILLLPLDKPQSITFIITLANGVQFRFVTPKDWGIEKAKVYTKKINLQKKGGSTDPDTPEEPIDPKPLPQSPYIEYPSLDNLTSTQRLIMHVDPLNPKQRSFTMLFDSDVKFAYWIAFPHHKGFMGSSGRTDAWGYDPKVPENEQPNLKSAYVSYSRGHQVASSDRTKSKELNRQTFYYSNMTPQIQAFNGGIWLQLERAVQDLVKSTNDTIYMVTGAGFYDRAKAKITKTKSGQITPIPDYYYKLMARKINGKYSTIGYLLDHNLRDGDFRPHKKTVKEIEKITGFTFYQGLPDQNVKNVLGENIWN